MILLAQCANMYKSIAAMHLPKGTVFLSPGMQRPAQSLARAGSSSWWAHCLTMKLPFHAGLRHSLPNGRDVLGTFVQALRLVLAEATAASSEYAAEIYRNAVRECSRKQRSFSPFALKMGQRATPLNFKPSGSAPGFRSVGCSHY